MTSKREYEKSNIAPFQGQFSSGKLPAGKLPSGKLSSATVSPIKFVNHPEPATDKRYFKLPHKINPVWTVERLFGKHHWASQWVIGLCEVNQQFLLHLIDQSPDYMHFICLVRLALLEHTVHEEKQLTYVTQILTQSKQKIIQELYPNSKGILGVLPRLPKKPLCPEDYRQLIRSLADDTMRKHLCHAKHVRKFSIHLLGMFILDNIPKEFHVRGVFNCIKNLGDYEAFLLSILPVQALNIEITQKEVDTATKAMDDIQQIQDWLNRKFEKAPFPPPPWQGNEWIKPVCSRCELQVVANKFVNCVMSYVVQVVIGHQYFYVCERTPAVIAVTRDFVFGWSVHTIEGARQEAEIDFVHRREIMQTFAGAGFLPLPTHDIYDHYGAENHCQSYHDWRCHG